MRLGIRGRSFTTRIHGAPTSAWCECDGKDWMNMIVAERKWVEGQKFQTSRLRGTSESQCFVVDESDLRSEVSVYFCLRHRHWMEISSKSNITPTLKISARNTLIIELWAEGSSAWSGEMGGIFLLSRGRKYRYHDKLTSTLERSRSKSAHFRIWYLFLFLQACFCCCRPYSSALLQTP
jgi:hypothetical protein